MPRELPQPVTKARPGSSAGRCPARPVATDRKLIQQGAEPVDALFESGNWILPVPTILGPFGFTTAFKRISAHLKPFVRLPLQPESESDSSTKPQCRPRRRASSLPGRETEQLYTYTSFDDLVALAPAPWSPVGPVPPMKLARASSPHRSETMDTSSTNASSATHHMTMLAMYRSGQLNSRYSQVSPFHLTQADNRVSKKRRNRQHARRRSTYRHPIPNTRPPCRDSGPSSRPTSSRVSSNVSASTASTSATGSPISATGSEWSDARANNSSSTTLNSRASSYHSTKSRRSVQPVPPKVARRLHFHRPPRVMTQSSAYTSVQAHRGEAELTGQTHTARSALKASLYKYARRPSPTPSLSQSPPSQPQSPFMFPHDQLPARQLPLPLRKNTVDTIDTVSTMSTYGSHLTDSLAVRYRASRDVVRRFVNGHWVWLPAGDQQPPPRSPVLLDEVADDGEEVEPKEWWRGWWQGGGGARWW